MTPPRVLIVDDNPSNIILAEFILKRDAMDVSSADGAAAALRVLPAFGPHLVLMDIQMPGMDGVTLTRLLKADAATSSIIIVAWTAYAMQGDEERAVGAGCDGYLTKPIDVHQFAAQVRSFLPTATPPYLLSA